MAPSDFSGGPAAIRTSDTRRQNRVPEYTPVARLAIGRVSCAMRTKTKIGMMSARRAARLGRRALQETGDRLPHSAGWTPSGIIEETDYTDVLFRSLAPMTERNPGLTNR